MTILAEASKINHADWKIRAQTAVTLTIVSILPSLIFPLRAEIDAAMTMFNQAVQRALTDVANNGSAAGRITEDRAEKTAAERRMEEAIANGGDLGHVENWLPILQNGVPADLKLLMDNTVAIAKNPNLEVQSQIFLSLAKLNAATPDVALMYLRLALAAVEKFSPSDDYGKATVIKSLSVAARQIEAQQGVNEFF
jgi:hypothetical protein